MNICDVFMRHYCFFVCLSNLFPVLAISWAGFAKICDKTFRDRWNGTFLGWIRFLQHLAIFVQSTSKRVRTK